MKNKNNKPNINNYNDLKLWKVDINLSDNLKDIDIITEEQIKNKGEELVTINYFKKYFPNQDAVDKSLIFIQVSTTTENM
ncbi:hypothetical protein C1645_823848 [Glomus cerebriforme]|uniref:Uncharacterized protein n=1 Tax=Glomus cerebriforme TaxID=658196 RepID=A0A397SWR4_9GLOM|nr:hypothetical protein C1645_823848 [Glomus cerebriforme]